MKDLETIFSITLAGVSTAVTSLIHDWLGIALTTINLIVMLIQIGKKVLPKIVTFFKTLKRANEDGKIDDDEKEELKKQVNEITGELNEGAEQIKGVMDDANRKQ